MDHLRLGDPHRGGDREHDRRHRRDLGVDARSAGIVIVSLNAMAQLLFMPSYPFWALSAFTLDVLVLFGLAAHGRRPKLR
jgi:hypothetical protein